MKRGYVKTFLSFKASKVNNYEGSFKLRKRLDSGKKRGFFMIPSCNIDSCTESVFERLQEGRCVLARIFRYASHLWLVHLQVLKIQTPQEKKIMD
jgi:hypothetical protein